MSLYKDASLVMIPSAVKDGKLYSIRPVEELGDELVTNGNFATDSDWTKGTGSTISGGSLNIVAAPYNANTKQNISLTSGVTYKVVINYTASGTATSNTFQLGFGDSAGNPSDTTQYEFAEGSGVKTFSITASAGDASILFRSRDAGTCDLSIHSVSVKEAITANGDFTFSRGSNLAATRVDVNGLIEKGRENLLLQSNQFDTTWNTFTASVTSGQIGYDGTNDAWLLDVSVANGSVYQSINQNNLLTASIYAKKGTANGVRFRMDHNIDSNVYVDLRDGSLSDSTNSAAINIQDVGNGWYRISVAFVAVNMTTIVVYPTDGNTTSSTGTIYIQDAQLESSMVATDYIETGASTAQAGILEDLPRLDYSGGASCPSLLLEPQRTNMFSHSEYFGGMPYQTRVIITDNAIVSPEGVSNAAKLVATTANGSHGVDYIPNVIAASYSMSVYAKAGETSKFVLLTNNRGSNLARGFDVSNGPTFASDLGGYGAPTSYSITEVGNDWYYCTIQFSKTSSGGSGNGITLTNADGQHSFTGNGTDGMYFYGWQMEQGSYPTSYIPTMGSAVTRSKDFMSNTNNLLSGLDNMCWFIDYTLTTESTSSFRNEVGYRDNSNANLYMVQFPNSNTHEFRYTGVAGVNVDMTPSIDEATYGLHRKIVYLKRGTTLKVFCNGVEVSTTTNASATTFSTTDENLRIGNNYPPELDVHQFLVFPTALTDSECIALTTL